MVTHPATGTNVHEIAEGIYRINTPVPFPDGNWFSFNQYLIDDEEPTVFHAGPRKLFPLVREAIAHVLPLQRLRHIGLSHVEADECGALNDFLAIAPQATPLCSRLAAMVSIDDLADRPAQPLGDGERRSIGHHVLRWFDTPHMPHGWECGLMFDETTGTLFCGDLFTQPGRGEAPLTEADILGPSEAFRKPMDYFAHAPNTGAALLRLADTAPRTLACMHGSAWQGDGASMLRSLRSALGEDAALAD